MGARSASLWQRLRGGSGTCFVCARAVLGLGRIMRGVSGSERDKMKRGGGEAGEPGIAGIAAGAFPGFFASLIAFSFAVYAFRIAAKFCEADSHDMT